MSNYQVNLQFTANTQQAKQQLQSLQSQLSSLINQPVSIGDTLTADIQQATHAAAELKVHLQNATNVKTGSLDFGKLNASIKQSGMSLQEYGAQLQSLGPKGQQAFMALAQSVAASEIPLRRSSAALNDMLVSLKNTVKWQMSSSLMHGVISSVQKAYGYAQDLNESLNNIRIVTGQNIDQMAKFAEEANKAAKALSTTTTEYTNASLIYYQQGLNDQQVKERTDITIKMANVARQSAEVVSDQMTAVWNNFYDGSKSLEHYADVMTALGAATASSTDEIAEGLNKFAAIADTVGLSYEYAASALATVTATTRQSADVVGTAFKTLFARIQDLELGKTLDDGTTLGKYSQALSAVGVSIKDSNGDMRKMDDILSDMASKWETLSKDQQTALAQTVAGVRQYTQLIALMDNWDFMKQNLATSEASSGTLNEQAKIYAESWEAARDRVTASAEKMYSALLDDKFFIKLTNGFADLTDSLGSFIKQIGGLQGVLSTLGVIVTKIFDKQIAQGFRNLAYNIQMSSNVGRTLVREEKYAEARAMADMMAQSASSGLEQETAKMAYTQQLEAQAEYIINAEHMTEAEREKYQILLEQYQVFGQQSIEIAKQIELLKEQQAHAAVDIMGSGMNAGQSLEQMTKHMERARFLGEDLGTIETVFAKIGRAGNTTAEDIARIERAIRQAGGTKQDLQSLGNALNQIQDNGSTASAAMDQVRAVMQKIQTSAAQDILKKSGIKEGTDEYNRLLGVLRQYMSTVANVKVQTGNLQTNNQKLTASFVSLKAAIKASGVDFQDWATALTGVTSGLMSAGMMISSFKSLKQTLESPDVSGWERFGAVLTNISMIMMSMSGLYKGLVSLGKLWKAVTDKETWAKIANAAATYLQERASRSAARAKDAEEQEIKENTAETNKNTAAKIANKAADSLDGKKGKGTTKVKVTKKGTTPKTTPKKVQVKAIPKGKAGGTVAKGAGKTAVKETGKTAGKKLLNPGTLKTLGSFAAGAAIVAASVAIAAVAISKAIDYYHRHEAAADRAAESAARLAESYNEVKEAETAFRDSVSSYESAKEGLDQLTKGTTEYKEAVMQANEKALELLKTNKDLSYTIDKDTGLIEIDEEELAKAEEASLHKEKMAQYSALAAEQNAKNKRLEADRVQFTREQAKSGTQTWDDDDTTVAAGAGIAAGALGVGGGLLAAGAVNGWNPVGWVLLAAGALTALVGGAMMLFSNDAQELEQEALDAIAQKRHELGRDLSAEEIKEVAIKYDDTGKLGESLTSTTEALNNTNDMAEAINENTAALRANSELILSQEYGSAAAEWLVDTYDSKYNSKKAELEELNKNINRAEDLDEGSEASQFIAQYEALTGKQMDWDYHVAANGDDEREFIYYETNPETGEKEEKRMNYQDMIEEMAVAFAMAEQSEEAAKVRNMLTNIEATQGINTANALASWTTTGELGDGITLSNFDTLQSSIDAAGGSEAYLEQTYGKDINEIAKELGYGSATLLLESFDTAMADKQAEFQDAMEKIPDAMQESFKAFTDKNVALGELTAKEYNAITAPLQEAFVKGGETGYKMVEGLLDNADTGAEMTALGEALSGIDWEKATPDSLREKLDELGVSTEMTTIELEALIGVMTDGIIKVSQIGQEYASLLSALQSGDSINYEQYLQMVERGLGSYFTYMYDGTYKLIDAATGFGDILKDITQNDYRENMAQAENRLSEIQTEVATKTAALDALGSDTINKATGSTDLLLANYTQGKVSMNADGKGATQNYTDWVTSEKEYTRTVKNYGLFGWDWLAADSKITGTETVVEEKEMSQAISQAAVDTYNARIDYIEALGIVSDDMIESWRTSEDMVATEKLIVETYLPQAIQAHEDLAILEEKQKLEMFKMEQALASTATTFAELQGLKDSGDIGTEAWWQAYEAMSNQEDMEGLDAGAVQEYSDYLASANIESDIFSDELQGNAEAAKEVAKDVMKLNNGVDKLASNFEDWNDILEKSDEGSQEYAEAMNGVRDAMSDVLGISEEYIDNDYIVENLEDIEKAAKGDAEAIDRLKAAMAENIICKIMAVDNFSDLDTSIQTLHNKLLDLNTNIEIGASLETGDFVTAANDLITKTGMTVDQAQAYFNSLGYEPTFVTEKKTVPLEGTRTYTENVVIGEKALNQGGATVPFQYIAQSDTRTEAIPMGTQEIDVPALSGDGTPQIKSLTKTSSGSANNYSSSNPGGKTSGGGSEPKKTQRTHHSSVVDRYKEVNDQLSDTRKAMEDASRAADGLWGAARLKKMREVQTEMGKELKLLRQQKAEAEAYLVQDKKWLEEVAAENGVTFTFDGNNISNYEEVMNGLYAELRQAEIDAGATTDDDEQERIDAIQERIDALSEAIGIYDQTKDEVKEFDTAIQEAIRGIQEANLEELNLQLEMEIMIDDTQLKKIEYYLDKTKEDIWGMAEAAALMTGQSKDLFNIDLGQVEVWTGKFADFQKQYDDLVYAYTHIDPKTGETFINQEQFVKALEELQSQIYDNLGNINELDKTMIGYYGETLAAAAEELSKFTDMMDHHNEVLDHYQSLLEIMGKSKDFERMKTLLKTQVEVSKNSAEVSKANYEMLQAELAEKKAAYEALDPNDTSYEAQVIKQQWLDAQAAANEAQLKMLEDAEAWAESLKALLETELEELGDNLEKALAGDFGSLDYMMTSMERANSLQEEYLTTTNKVYETNKLMRTAQQEIDKTSNTVAKRRMAQFIEETQQMQNQNKLSQYELEIQQAKYDLLLAEIALEEAQSAKSTVRLQRDNEGNFGYVYTADQNEVANAQQQLEDAQNALYNIGLEGANKYAEQYAQTIQEMNDAVRELTEQWQNGEITSKEEYQAKMLELEEYYGEKLKQFSHLHSVAVQTDSRVANEAWTRDFAHMTTQTGMWMTQVSGYASQVTVAFGNYQKGIAEVEQYAGADLDSLKTKTENIKTENEKLVTSITDPDKGLLQAMQKEIDKVDGITQSYKDWRTEIQGAIADQEKLAKLIGQEIETETDDDETNDRKPVTETTPETTPPEGEPGGNPGDDGTPSYKKGVLSWTGNGSARIWTDSAGKTYSATSAEGRAIQTAFNKAYGANGGYKGDYFLGWNKLNADVLHEKYGLSTGGYTGDWSGSFGKLAFLHQKELVLNKQDTENLLAAMEFLNRITSAIDLQAMNSSLGGLLSSPSLGHVGDESGILEQQVHIEASFPGVSDRNELEEAFNNLINQAAQYANRK